MAAEVEAGVREWQAEGYVAESSVEVLRTELQMSSRVGQSESSPCDAQTGLRKQSKKAKRSRFGVAASTSPSKHPGSISIARA